MSDENDGVKAAGAGAVTGTVGSVAAVSGAGAVTGLGATGITSGLSAIGATVGGGMASGLAITAAAPLAIGAVGYGLYKWLKD